MAKQGGGLESQLIKGERFAAGPYVPIGSIAAAGFEKGFKTGKAIIEKQKQEEFERRKLEAENFEKQQDEINKTLLAFRKNASEATVNADLVQGFWKERLNSLVTEYKDGALGIENSIKSGKVSQYDALKQQDENNLKLKGGATIVDNYVATAAEVDAISSNLSSTVSSEVTRYANGILNGDKEIIKEISNKFKIDIDEVVSPNTLKTIGYKAADTEGINTLFNTTQKAAQSAAQKGAGKEGYMDSVRQGLAQLKLSDEQYVSAAFDFLGKETPGFTSPFKSYIDSPAVGADIKDAIELKDKNLIKDANDSGSNIDEIKEFVNKAMLEAAEDSYESFKSDYADKYETSLSKDDEKPNEKQLLAKERAERLYKEIKTDPQGLINRIYSNADFRVSENVVQFFTTENGKRVEDGVAYNLNTPSGIKGLLSDLSKKYYGTGGSEDLMLDEFDKLAESDEDFKFSSVIFPTTGNEITTGNLPIN